MTGWRGTRYITQAGNVHTEERKKPMAATIWCEIDDPETNALHQIGHPFSAKDPDKRHFSQTRTVDIPTGNSYGRTTYQEREEVTDELDMCGYHWGKQNPFAVKKEINPPVDSAQATLDELEDEDSNYRAGYDAAMERVLSGRHAAP